MDLREFVRTGMGRARKNTLDSIHGLTEEEYSWLPGPEANPICFLLFHIARTEDRYFHRWLSPQTAQVWAREGLDKKYNLPINDTTQEVGNSWTIQQVHSFRYPSLEEVLRYMEQARASALVVLEHLDLSRLEQPLSALRPEQTMRYYLQAALLHEAAHQGAIDYLRGLYRTR